MLKKIEGYLRPTKLNELQSELMEEGVPGMSVNHVEGYGRTSEEDDSGSVPLEERTKIEIVVEEELVETVISKIKDLAGRGEVGAGKIFVLPVEDAIRISTDEMGRSAIR